MINVIKYPSTGSPFSPQQVIFWFNLQALVRFPPKDRLKRFGEPGTEEHKKSQSTYRTFIVDKLVSLSTRFITSIKANLHCFPPSLAWIVGQVFTALTNAGHVDPTEVRGVAW